MYQLHLPDGVKVQLIERPICDLQGGDGQRRFTMILAGVGQAEVPWFAKNFTSLCLPSPGDASLAEHGGSAGLHEEFRRFRRFLGLCRPHRCWRHWRTY